MIMTGDKLTFKSSSKEVSERMRRMPTANSKPEIRLRKSLYARGFRYRIHRRDLPGRPDIAFGPAKVAVFVDGCFWHNCPIHGTVPKSNTQWWEEKFKRNRKRDRLKDEQLSEIGWISIHVWEHENVLQATERIILAIQDRIN